MTLKEKVAEMMPETVNTGYEGGVMGCPIDYNFLNVTKIFCCDDCEKCWNAEFVEEEKNESQTDYILI